MALLASFVVVSAVPASASESSGAAAWGENNDGQLGNNTTTNEKEAVVVKVITEATAIAGGELHSLARLKSGKVMAWGENNDGQLGNGTTTNEKEPVEVKGLSEVVAIAAGANHSLALLKNGKVKAWGENNDGQLGNGTTTNEKEPVEVKGLSEVVAIAAGANHSLAVLKNGKIEAWGENNDGQLGNGTTTNEKEPVEVKGLTEVATIAAGRNHSLAVLKNGKIEAWGENNDGQLGNNTTTNEKEPVEVKGLSEAIAVAGGQFHSLALLKNGKVMAWGDNEDGQLGNGTTTTEKEAVEVKGLGGAIGGIAAGTSFSLASYATGPANTTLPTISGKAEERQTLTASTGTWTGTEPITYTYQWQGCNSKGESCLNISGAVSSTYKLMSSNVGDTARVEVTAKNAAKSTSAFSAATSVVAAGPPANTVPPAVSGTAESGQLLTLSNGNWEGTPTISYSYQWETCNNKGESCSNISGATASSYRILNSQVGDTLRAIVTASNSAGSEKATSAATATITTGPPVNTELPAISGTAKEGETLSAGTGSWAGGEPFTYTYQWKSCNSSGESCSNISSATSSTYKLTSSSTGKTLRIIVTAKNSVSPTEATSFPSAVIVAPPSNTALPTVSGDVKDGQALKANIGTWTGTEPLSYEYQWESCNRSDESCSNISGATSSTYVLGHSDVGSTLQVAIKATNSVGSASATSEATVAVAPLSPSNTTLPSISGEAKDGQTLSASAGEWEGTPPLTYTYQWESCSDPGESCANISGATSSTYVLGHGDVGTTLRVTVTATNSSGSTSATSAASDVVAARSPSNTALPTVSGETKEGQTLTASAGSWEGTPPITYAYQWVSCNSLGEDCFVISGATNSSYTLGTGEVGMTIRVVVTATNFAGPASATSEATAVVIAESPTGCTDTWTGGTSGSWQEGADWSTGEVPKSGDRACIGAGQMANLTSGSYRVGSIEGEGALNVHGGSLELTSVSVESHVSSFEIGNGTLSGPGTLVVSSWFFWGGEGVLSGSGRTVLGPKASGAAYFSIWSGTLDERTFVNEGSFEWYPGALDGENGGVFENKGTFDDISEGAIFSAVGGAAPSIKNIGTFEKTSGDGGAKVEWEIDNQGTIEAQAGALEFSGGDVPGINTSGSWKGHGEGSIAIQGGTFSWGSVELTGDIDMTGVSLSAGDLQGPSARLEIYDSSLELTDASTISHMYHFQIGNGTLSGPGTLEISGEFFWGGEGVLSGSGRTVLGPKALGAAYFSIWSGTLDERTFVNEGSFEWYPGALNGENGGVFENKGTFDDISEGIISSATGGAPPVIENTGTFEKTMGSGTAQVGFEFDNNGRVEAQSGTLDFTGGGLSEQVATGSWGVENSTGSIVLGGGTFFLAKGRQFNARIEGATVIWTSYGLMGLLEPQPYASGMVTISGSGERGISGPFESTQIEIAPLGTSEWQTLCGSLTPDLDGAFSCFWNTASGPYPDGSYQLRAQLSSDSSPTETVLTPTITTLVDNTPPTGSVTEPSHDVDGQPTITGTASDSGSGVRSWQLQIAPKDSSEWTNACSVQSTPITGDTYGCTVNTTADTDGSYELRAVITDRAGNTSTTSTVSMHIGNAALSGTLAAVPPYIGKTVEVSGTASSTGVNVASWAVQLAPAGTSSWSSACPIQGIPHSGSEYRCSMDTTTFSDGDYQLRALITDAEDNSYTTPPIPTTIDNTPPVGVLFPLLEGIAGELEVQGYSYDAGSGVAGWALQIAPAGSEAFKEACPPQSSPISTGVYGCSIDTAKLASGSYLLRAVINDNVGNTYTTPTITTTVENATLSSSGAPIISGEVVFGRALSASSGSWSASGTISYAYQWQNCNSKGEACTSIEGATSTSYVLGAGDVGGTLRVVVTASDGLEEVSATSSPSAVVQANALANVFAPTISGSPDVGATLNADPSSWRGAPPISYTYQWQRCNASGGECANIASATKQSYLLNKEDVSSTLRIVVTAINGEGSASATSAASAVVGAGSGSGIRYLYDKAGRLHIIDDPSHGAAVYQWDADGNLTSIKRYSASTVAVLAVTPPHSPPGTQVDITGTGFNANPSEDEVSFDGTTATVSEATSTDLIVTVPEGAGTGAIVVTIAGHSAESPDNFAPDNVRVHPPDGGLLHLPIILGSVSAGSATTSSQTNVAPTAAGATLQASSQPSTSQAAAAKKACARLRGSDGERSCVQAKRARSTAKHHARSKKKSARRTRHATARSHHHGKPRARHIPRRASAKAPSHRARTAANMDPGSTTAGSRAAPQTLAGSPHVGTAIPTAISDYHSPYSSSWTPSAKNRKGGDWLTGDAPSPWAKLPALSAPRNATGLSGQALIVNGTPLANVTLTIEGMGKQAKTDNSGRFLLMGLPAGHHVLIIDGTSADSAGRRFGRFTVGIELVNDKVTPLGYTIWMTPLEAAGDSAIQSPLKHETALTNPRIPGFEVRLPAGTVIHSADGSVVRHVNLTAVPVDRPPFPLPLFGTDVPTYFTVQPGGAYLSKGAQIIYPNWSHLPPGQRVDFWNYDPADKGWYIYGEGSVSENGTQVIPDPNVHIWEFTGAMISSGDGPPPSGPASGGPGGGPGPGAGDPVDLGTGLFVWEHTDLTLPDSVMPVALTRTYRPGDNNSYSFGIGAESSFDMRLWSNENYKAAYLVLPDGGKIKLQRTSPGTGYLEAVYKAVETAGPWEGAVMEYDTAATSDGGWVLRKRDGTKFIFGDFAPLQAIEDRDGNRITLVREGGPDGPIIQIHTPHGRSIDLTYDSYNRITQATDNAGQAVKYAYDSAGRLVKVTDPTGGVTRYAYNSENEMTSVTDARGDVLVANTYNTNGRVLTQTVGGKGMYTFNWLPACSGCEAEGTSAVEVIDPEGHKRYTYFEHWLPTAEVQNPGSSEEWTTYTRDASGNITRIASSSGASSYSYNMLGNMTSVKHESSTLPPLITSYTYNGFSEPTSDTNPLGQTTSYTYDANGNLTDTTDPMGQQTSYGYNSEGERISETDPQGNTTTYAYEDGNQVGATNPLGEETRTAYDSAGRPASVINAEGGASQFAYNEDNELIGETDPAGDKTSYGYDADGNLISVTDPRDHTQTGTYNALNQLESWTDALGGTTTYTHDDIGNPTSVTDPEGHITTYSYNPLNRLSSVSFGSTGSGSPTSTITYGYDGAGNLTSVDDSRAGTYTLSYDNYNRLTDESGPNGSIGYSYNADGEREGMTIGGEEAASYSYNPDGQLTSIDTPDGNVSLTYDEDGLPIQVQLPDSDTESYSYNSGSKLTGIVYKGPEGTWLGNLEYGRDALGRVTTLSGSYARTSLPEAFSEASYNAGNEPTSLEGHTFSYDADGNLTSNGTSSFEWNDRNQLTDVTRGSEKWGFTYDPFGRRTSKTANGTTTSYLYDGQNVATEASAGKTAQLLNGLGLDKRYARTTSAGTDSYLTDDLSSTIALSNGSGGPVTEYTYGPFGATMSTGAESSNPYLYTGREAETNGLQYNRARYYNPTTGTFISQDPLGLGGSGVNLYRYAGDEPLDVTDPLGTTENPLETVPRGDGGPMRELDKEERNESPGGGNPGQPTNLAAPKGSGGWKKVGCEAATVVPGKAGLGVAGICGIEAPPIGHIPSLSELGEKAVGFGEEIINLP